MVFAFLNHLADADTTILVPDGDEGGLISAIGFANSEVPPFNGQDTIELTINGTYTLTGINNTTDGPNGLPSITSNIVINGNGAVLQRSIVSGIPDFRVFHIGSAGTLTLNGLDVLNGQVTSDGGNIYSLGQIVLNGSTIAAGNANSGGGIFSNSSALVATNTTISGNNATFGGAIFIGDASCNLLNVTITGNTADNFTAGIMGVGSASLTYQNSLIAGNTGGAVECSVPFITSNGNNLLPAGPSGCIGFGSDLTTGNIANELDTMLANNGGPTLTHALISGSQAIDTGNDGAAPVADQRGQLRVDGDSNGTITSDIGSYEFVGCQFCDEFNDNVLASNWTYINNMSDWSESSDAMIGIQSRKTQAHAIPAFGGCTMCYAQTIMRSTGGQLSFLFHVVDKDNLVELLMDEAKDKWVLKHRINKSVVSKQKFLSTIDPSMDYTARLRFDGTNFIASINGTDQITLAPGGVITGGSIGFKVKGTTGTFQRIEVN